MSRFLKIAAIAFIVSFSCTGLIVAQDKDADPAAGTAATAAPATPAVSTATPLIKFGGPIGAGLVVIGAAFGIGKLAASALESMARQPEVAGSIQIAMLIAAALIEGFTFFALFICYTQP